MFRNPPRRAPRARRSFGHHTFFSPQGKPNVLPAPDVYKSDAVSKTRSGVAFSPWVTDLGLPIYAPLDFDLAERVNAALTDPSTGTTQEPPDDDDPLLAMFTSDATMNTGGPQPPEETIVIPPLPVFEDPPTTSDSISKHAYHTREHAKKRRRAAATGLHGISDAKPPLKAAALRHRDAAVPVITTADTSSTTTALANIPETTTTLLQDDLAAEAAAAAASEPIMTDFSLQMEDLPVASTAFQGQRYKQTAADREPKTLEKLREEGFAIVEWKGL